MKIYCDVQVLNRVGGTNAGGRSQKSTLAIGSTPKDDSQIFIIHFTNTNKSGTRYNLKDNLENVFCKFINEGKATIRFKTPALDLCIKADPTQLKGFLKTLKCTMSGELPRKDLALSNLTAMPITKKMQPVKTLNILTRAQYPTKGFPRTLENLSVTGIGLEQFGTQVLQLRNLRTLDLSKNCLKGIPAGIGTLPHLAELNLSENKFYQCKLQEWDWLDGEAIRKSLKTLNLSHNRLAVLPDNVVRLQELISLKVNNNQLQMLPNGISRMRKLKSLFVNVNRLKYVPFSLYVIRLRELDVSFNNFRNEKYAICEERNEMTLVELCARKILACNIKYSSSQMPKCLCRYLDSSTLCICRKPIVNKYSSCVVLMNSRALSESIVVDQERLHGNTPIKMDTCTKQCHLGLHNN